MGQDENFHMVFLKERTKVIISSWLALLTSVIMEYDSTPYIDGTEKMAAPLNVYKTDYDSPKNLGN